LGNVETTTSLPSRKWFVPALPTPPGTATIAVLMLNHTIVHEFKAFILKGNVVDLAVGVVIGAAFGKVVESVVKDLITPIVGAIGGQPNFSAVYLGPLAVGSFLNAIIAFLILAAVIFFLVVKPMNALKELTQKKAEEKPTEPAPIPEDVKLLIEIRDLLKAKASA
jgi:large conductance mechanosensitive channel